MAVIDPSNRGLQLAVRYAVLTLVAIIFAFLRSFRSTVIICTSIPISIFGTFALLYFGGYTLNTMTFGGLALGVGMIVDAAIVVLENTERHMHMGKSPYQAAIGSDIERRLASGQETILVALHSFTPSMQGIDRPWQVGLLHDAGDNRFSRAMLAFFAQDPALVVGDNEPYSMDIIDYTIPFHSYERRLPYAEIEIRQDLLSDDGGIDTWCDRVEQALNYARAEFERL